MAVAARPIKCNQIEAKEMPTIFGNSLVPTRLRLVNTGYVHLLSQLRKLTRNSSIAGFTIGISHAKLIPLQVDGGCEIVGSASAYVGIIYPGERADILIEWDPQVKNTGSSLEIILDPEFAHLSSLFSHDSSS
jgi:hypothetical protein